MSQERIDIGVVIRRDPAEAEVRAAERRAAGHRVEVIAQSDTEDELTHLGQGGVLVHRVSAARSYAFKAARAVVGRLSPRPAFAVRLAEKIQELESIWNRRVLWVDAGEDARQLRRMPWLASLIRLPGAGETSAAAAAAGPVTPPRSVDVIVPSFNRFEELLESLPSVLAEVERARGEGVDAQLTVVFQNEGLPERVLAARPEWGVGDRLRFAWSAPPSLTRARNQGIRATGGDLVVFVDDDVYLDPGFLRQHLAALERHPTAIGVAGRVKTRLSGGRATQERQVGQVRWSGHVDANFDSIHQAVAIVPQSPMGTNMSFLRSRMTALFGDRWFDEAFDGSAWREETTLGVELVRRGEHLLFAPLASLYHFEAVAGGCENREVSPEQREARLVLENLFLKRLYRDSPLGRAAGPALLALREARTGDGPRLQALLRGARAFLRSRDGGR